MCIHDPPTPTPLAAAAAAFEALTPAQQAAALDLLARLIVALTPRAYTIPGGNLPPVPGDWRATS